MIDPQTMRAMAEEMELIEMEKQAISLAGIKSGLKTVGQKGVGAIKTVTAPIRKVTAPLAKVQEGVGGVLSRYTGIPDPNQFARGIGQKLGF